MLLIGFGLIIAYHAIKWAWPRREHAGEWRYHWPFDKLIAWNNAKRAAELERLRNTPGYWDNDPRGKQYWLEAKRRAAEEAEVK